MSKKRPTESSWDSDEELLSDTAGISAFPKSSELDLLAEDGELDEEALLGLDESGAAFHGEALQPGVNRQRSKNAGSSHQDDGALANQAFVFEVADTGDLEEELTGNQGLATYGQEEGESYSHNIYEEDPSGGPPHQIATETDQHVYTTELVGEHGDGAEVHDDQGNYIVHDDQASEVYLAEQSDLYSETGTDVLNEHTGNDGLEYDNSVQESDEVHLEYEDGQSHIPQEQIGADQAEDHQEQAYESDSDSEDDSRHNRGKFKSERTGVISLSATTERESIPDTLEINENQAAQIKEFMSEKSTRDRGRGGRNRGRLSVHNRLGIRPGLGPPPGRGMMFGGDRMRMMNPRFQSPPGPRGLGIPRRLLGPRHMLGGMRPQMPPRGPVMGGPFNPMFAGARRPPGGPGGDRFPLGPMRPPGNIPMIGPGALLEPMKQLLQRMRGPHPGSPRMGGPGVLRMPEGLMGIPMPGRGNMRGPEPRLFLGDEPRVFLGSPQNRMLRPPQQLLSPNQSGSLIMGPGGIQTSPNLPGQMKQPIRGRLPLYQRLGPAGATHQSHLAMKNKIFLNPMFQGQQGGPMGLKRTVKMGVPMHQRKAKALLEKAKLAQMKQTSSSVVATKRKSTGGDDVASKVAKKEEEEEQSVRVVEKKEPGDEGSTKVSSMLEEQKRKREMIQKRKELARQRLAEEKRKELEKTKSEGNKIQSIVGRSVTSDERKVEKSNAATSIKVVSRSMASRLGPPPAQAQKIQFQNRGPPPQSIRGPQVSTPFRGQQFQNIRGPNVRSPQQGRGVQSPRIRGPHSQQVRGMQQQQMRGLQPRQIIGQQPQQMRGPPPHHIRNPQGQLRGNLPQQFSNAPQQQRLGAPLQQNLSNPPPQVVIRAQTVVNPQRLSVPPPQHIQNQPPPQIGGPNLPRGPPTQQIRGLQQTYQGHGRLQIRGPPPQQSPLHMRPPSSPQVNPAQQQVIQLRGPPPVGPQAQTQVAPPTFGFQASSPATPRFISQPSYPQPQQQQQSQYDASFAPQSVTPTQPPPIQQHQYSVPPPQAPQNSSQYYHGSPSVSSEPAHNVNYSQPTYQQNFSSQPSYQQPGASLYSGAAPSASSALTQQSAAPTYQYSQAYRGTSYENPQPAPVYQSQQQYATQQQQGQTSFPPAHDAGYSSSSDYFNSSQTIRTVQTTSNQSYQDHSQEGQKIQTIGQHIQPVTGTQMRSIITNVEVSPKSSTSARSVQQKTPTLHISRAVMEGNVPVLPGSQKVIILNVPQMATRETLIRLCRHFGHVEGVNLMRDQNKAVVQFQKGEQAAKCVSKCDQKCLHKTRLTVKLLPS